MSCTWAGRAATLTPALGGGVSMGIHESQCRFYENIIGRSRAYVRARLSLSSEGAVRRRGWPTSARRICSTACHQQGRAVPDPDGGRRADLLPAHHGALRAGAAAVRRGTLAAHDVPAEWKRLYKAYLGVDVPSDREGMPPGFSHWSGNGSIGYFPSYALGSGLRRTDAAQNAGGNRRHLGGTWQRVT